ncbi:hypothetical protein C0431_12875 [bacterium]|nr:hypothetical protein [bacterium]
MSYFSLEDLFEQGDGAKATGISKVMPPSENSEGVYAVMVPDTRGMSQEEVAELLHRSMGALFIQEALLNAMADLLIEKGIFTEPELKKCFEELLDKGPRPQKE